jgi:hypothetical protein
LLINWEEIFIINRIIYRNYISHWSVPLSDSFLSPERNFNFLVDSILSNYSGCISLRFLLTSHWTFLQSFYLVPISYEINVKFLLDSILSGYLGHISLRFLLTSHWTFLQSFIWFLSLMRLILSLCWTQSFQVIWVISL